MPLPDPTGPHRVGIIEADVPAPTDAGVVPVVVYYPAIDEPDAVRAGRVGERHLYDCSEWQLCSLSVRDYGSQKLAHGHEVV